jgi:glutathione S-transferase
MKLFTYATSPYARKVRMALDYKGVSYEPLERCYSIDRKEDLRCVTPRAEVPTVVLDDGRTITDSTIICEYLEEVYPEPPLYPKDTYERARMERMRRLPVVIADHERIKKAMAELRSLADEVKGPDGRIHWRDSRVEWPIRHGFIDLVAREFHAGKMMFPPDAS